MKSAKNPYGMGNAAELMIKIIEDADKNDNLKMEAPDEVMSSFTRKMKVIDEDITVDEFEKYKTQYKRRLSICPGITGLWQATGRSDITDFEQVLKLDLEYIDNWSISLDIKILFMTVFGVLLRKGAK